VPVSLDVDLDGRLPHVVEQIAYFVVAEALTTKIRNALAFFRTLDGAPGVEVRCHGTTLYNSIYRYDDEMIVNPHVYGIPAPHAPALHLRRLSAGCLVETYAQSFDRVWETAKPPKW